MFKKELEQYKTLITQAKAEVKIRGSFITKGFLGDDDYEEENVTYEYDYLFNGDSNVRIFSARLRALSSFLETIYIEGYTEILTDIKLLEKHFIKENGNLNHKNFEPSYPNEFDITENDFKEFILESYNSVHGLISVLDGDFFMLFKGNNTTKRDNIKLVDSMLQDLSIIDSNGKCILGERRIGTLWALIYILTNKGIIIKGTDQSHMKAFWKYIQGTGSTPKRPHKNKSSYIDGLVEAEKIYKERKAEIKLKITSSNVNLNLNSTSL